MSCYVSFLVISDQLISTSSRQSASAFTSREMEIGFHSEDTSPPTSSITTTLLISGDPAQLPDALSHPENCTIITRAPIQIKDIVFPQNTDKTSYRFKKVTLFEIKKKYISQGATGKQDEIHKGMISNWK